MPLDEYLAELREERIRSHTERVRKHYETCAESLGQDFRTEATPYEIEEIHRRLGEGESLDKIAYSLRLSARAAAVAVARGERTA